MKLNFRSKTEGAIKINDLMLKGYSAETIAGYLGITYGVKIITTACLKLLIK